MTETVKTSSTLIGFEKVYVEFITTMEIYRKF